MLLKRQLQTAYLSAIKLHRAPINIKQIFSTTLLPRKEGTANSQLKDIAAACKLFVFTECCESPGLFYYIISRSSLLTGIKN